MLLTSKHFKTLSFFIVTREPTQTVWRNYCYFDMNKLNVY